jgi:hypothetical protein
MRSMVKSSMLMALSAMIGRLDVGPLDSNGHYETHQRFGIKCNKSSQKKKVKSKNRKAMAKKSRRINRNK